MCDAQAALRQYDGQWVELNVNAQDYRVQPMARPDVVPTSRRPSRPRASCLPDLSVTALKPLSALKARDSRYCGVKAANLGALKSALPPATRVPDGFCVPFSQYEAFMRRLRWRRRSRRWNSATISRPTPTRDAKLAAAGRDRRRRAGRGAGAILAGAVEQPAQGQGRVRAQLVEFGRPARLQRRGPHHHGAQRDPGRGAGARGADRVGLGLQLRGL